MKESFATTTLALALIHFLLEFLETIGSTDCELYKSFLYKK